MLAVAPSGHDGLVPRTPDADRPFVGRSQDLEHLVGLLGVGGDPGGAVLLGGDAGVGKTRLLGELARAAEAAGWRVLVGHCLDFGEDAVPYLPFSELFGRLAAEEPAVVSAMVERNPDVARLLPGHRGLQEAATLDRGTLLEALPRALEHLSRSAPLLLVIEDVHWADPSTQDLLGLLLARRAPDAVSVVASFRADDLHRRHPLRSSLAEWTRLPGVTRVPLTPLDDSSVRTLVRALHPGGIAEREVAGIVSRAEGNAFFTEELVAAVGLGEQVLSADLADLLLVRLDRLDATARGVLRAASVAGRTVSHEALAAVVGLAGAELESALRTAVDRNLLVAAPHGYSFRHALLAEAVYDDLLPGERSRLHAAYARELVEGRLVGTSAELARHARAAQDVPTALRASIAAGKESMAVGGPSEAVHHFEHALELLGSGPHDIDVLDLVLRAGEAAIASGRLHRALALLQDHLARLPADAPDHDRAELLHAVAATAVLDDTPIDVLQVTSEALRLLPAEPPTALRARVLAAHARANSNRGRLDEAARAAQEAIDLGEQLGLAVVVAEAMTTMAALERGDTPEAAELALTQSIARARAAGEDAAELRSLYNLGQVHWEQGRLDEAQADYELGTARSVELGRPWAPYGVDARSMSVIVAYVRGDWEHALRLTDTTGESAPQLATAVLGSVRLFVAAGRGDAAARALLPALRPWWDRDGMIAIVCSSAAIDLHGDAGDIEAALAVHDDVVQHVGALWEGSPFQARIRLAGLILGQLCAAASRSSGIERTSLGERGAAVLASAEEAAAAGRRPGPESRAWLARTRAEHARLSWLTGATTDVDELVALWEVALEAFTEFGHVFEVARSQARLGAVLRAAGQASAHLAAATDTARRLHAAPLLRELGASNAAAPAKAPTVLTDREAEVLALVAEGRSNREIGQVLFISGKTVSVHVSNVLAKLQAAGRTEAVAVARRRGLLP